MAQAQISKMLSFRPLDQAQRELDPKIGTSRPTHLSVEYGRFVDRSRHYVEVSQGDSSSAPQLSTTRLQEISQQIAARRDIDPPAIPSPANSPFPPEQEQSEFWRGRTSVASINQSQWKFMISKILRKIYDSW